jgi:Zn-dependent metalloprotease
MLNLPPRRSMQCILPPHIVAHLAANGSEELRRLAIEFLQIDQSLRAARATFSLMGGLRIPHPATAAAPAQKKRTIYDEGHSQTLPGQVVRQEGQPASTDQAVNQAYEGLGSTFDFYLSTYHRNSIDNAGLPLVASVHYGQRYDNAFWNGQQMIFGDGDGVLFNGFTSSLDVIGHELTHGVTGSEANLTYQGQSGALNESISDVFGSLVKQFSATPQQTASQADWLIGAGLLATGVKGVALRSMKTPGSAYDDPMLGKDPQPADMAHYVHTTSDNGGVHINSGIPNRAFYLAATSIGGHAWEKTGRIWYDTVCDHNLRPTSTFARFADLTVRHAGHLWGSASTEAKAVLDAWKQVGVK